MSLEFPKPGFLGSLSIRFKLLAVVAVLAGGLSFYAVSGMLDKAQLASNAKETADVVGLVVASSELAHELQKERGVSASVLGGADRQDELRRQWEKTGQAWRAFTQTADGLEANARRVAIDRTADAVDAALQGLEAFRREVMARSLPAGAALSFYGGVDAKLLAIAQQAAAFASSLEVANMLREFGYIMSLKEYAGAEGALFAKAVAAGTLSPAGRAKLLGVIAREETFSNLFTQTAEQGLLDLLDAAGVREKTHEVEAVRSAALQGSGAVDVTQDQWRRVARGRLGALAQVEKGIAARARSLALEQAASAQRLFITYIAMLVGILLVGAFALAVTLGIARRVASLQATIGAVERDYDLSLRVKDAGGDELGEVGSALNRMFEKFSGTLSRVSDSATQMASAAQELSAVSEQSSQGIERQATEMEQLASAMTEMASAVQEVARHTERAAGNASTANGEAEQGRAVVGEVVESMRRLAERVHDAMGVIEALKEDSQQIGSVIDVIGGVADQTNLLALNAAIEAARAGEQGRGFAVVADEVRTLAARTQESTQEIQRMIESLQGRTASAVDAMHRGEQQTDEAVELAGRARSALSEIASAVSAINEMNLQIASAAEQQGAAAAEIDRNLVAVSDISNESAQGAQETARASEEVARLASDLQGLVAEFRTSASA